MAAVYSTRFITTHAGGAGSYTVPAGFKAVIRQIQGFNGSAVAPETAQLVSDVSGGTLFQTLIPPSEASYLECRFVFESGESFHTNNGSDIDCYVGGYLLALP